VEHRESVPTVHTIIEGGKERKVSMPLKKVIGEIIKKIKPKN